MTVRVLRPPSWLRLLCAAPMTVLSGVLVAGGIDEGGWLLGVCLAGAGAVLLVGARSWLLRVEVGHEVTIVNWLRTLHVPWSDVERFGYDSGLWVRRRSGRQHDIAAFPAVPGALPSADRRGRTAAAELEAIRKRRRR